jgi:carbohydrate kinase (thermoresistant glucokinase family)
MAYVPGLRSPYAQIGRLVYFGRMLDKIRLHAAGQLPADYQANLGDSQEGVFDSRCCRFLRVPYAEIVAQALARADDRVILEWADARGGGRTDDECMVWNSFMMKRGWHDPRENVANLQRRVVAMGLERHPIQTYFDLIDFDEGRDPVARRAWELPAPVAVVIMGVSGSGKTTIGAKLALELGWPFRDADEFHSPANIAKMAAGIPLDDADRAPWLAAIRADLDRTLARGESPIVTCSALKEAYRQVLRAGPSPTQWVYLQGDFALFHQRLEQRPDHYMKAGMLESQLAALEPPADAFTVDAALSPAAIVARIRKELGA